MSTSSEDEPNLAQLFGHQSQRTADRSDDSDLPDWIQSHTPAKQHAIDVSSHEDIDINAGRTRAAGAGVSAAAAAASAADIEQGGGDQHATAAPSGKQSAAKAGSSAAAATAAVPTGAAATDRSEVQVILPEKLIRHKVLIELEPALHQATELSGDAGAVGRLVASAATAEDGQFKLDLKGVLYQATVMPLAGTALVVNIGPTEAKVESVLNDFVRLREESSYHDTGMSLEGGYGMAELMADDEDNYQVAGEEGKEGKAKATAKQAAAEKRSKAASSKLASSRALKPAKAGVKKKPATSKAAGKGSKATPKKVTAAPKSKAPPKPAAKPKPAVKPKLAKRKKKQDTDDEDDWDDSEYSD